MRNKNMEIEEILKIISKIDQVHQKVKITKKKREQKYQQKLDEEGL